MGRLHMGSMGWPSLLFSVVILAASAVASAQAPDYNVGRAPSQDEIRAWDISIPPDGKGLLVGSGTAIEGAKLYVQKGCVVCHGPNGRGGLAPHLVGTKDTPTSSGSSEKVMATLSPFATVLWDFLYRAMPLQRAGTLKPDEAYALTAYLLYKNDIIQENEVIDAQTLLKVKMPNRDAFVPPDISAYKPGTPKSYLLNPDPVTEKK
jgi:S-disulfanyl-L-cysteine oxidoreductase SoxD